MSGRSFSARYHGNRIKLTHKNTKNVCSVPLISEPESDSHLGGGTAVCPCPPGAAPCWVGPPCVSLRICTQRDDGPGEALLRSRDRDRHNSQEQEGWGWERKSLLDVQRKSLLDVQRLSIGLGVPAGGAEGKRGMLSRKPSAPWGIDLPGPKYHLAGERPNTWDSRPASQRGSQHLPHSAVHE